MMTSVGDVNPRLLAVRGGLGWTEYRLKGVLVRRDSTGKLKGVSVKATADPPKKTK